MVDALLRGLAIYLSARKEFMETLMWTESGMVASEHGVYGQCTKCQLLEKYKLALELALIKLSRFEPGDSRAVSEEFVAMAAILSDSKTADDDCVKIVQRGITQLQKEV